MLRYVLSVPYITPPEPRHGVNGTTSRVGPDLVGCTVVVGGARGVCIVVVLL